MRPDIKQKRDLEKVRRAFEKLGLPMPPQEALDSSLEATGTATAVIQEAHLVLATLDRPDTVVTVECRICKQKFQTNYRYNKHCSEECLREGLKERGLIWDPMKRPEDRWQGVPPARIQPPTLERLVEWARELLSDYSPELLPVDSPIVSSPIPPNLPLVAQPLINQEIRVSVKMPLTEENQLDFEIEFQDNEDSASYDFSVDM